MQQGTLILTSTGLSPLHIREAFMNLVENPETTTVAIVTTAAEGKSDNKFSRLAQEQFHALGFSRVDFVDVERESHTDFAPYQVIYVCGGNTFTLLTHARAAEFNTAITELLSRGGIYIGVSAGSIILCPSIAIAGEVGGDTNDVGLADLTGLQIVEHVLLPHYEPEHEAEVQAFEDSHKLRVTRLGNASALVIHDGVSTLI